MCICSQFLTLFLVAVFVGTLVCCCIGKMSAARAALLSVTQRQFSNACAVDESAEGVSGDERDAAMATDALDIDCACVVADESEQELVAEIQALKHMYGGQVHCS